MKYILSFLIRIILVTCKNKEENKETTPVDCFAITTASVLNCRETPDINSKVITKYKFGTPLLLQKIRKNANSSESAEEWSIQVNDKCYVSNQFILDSKANSLSPLKYSPDDYHCIGTEGEDSYPIYKLGDIFIWVSHEMIGPAPSPENIKLSIGRITHLKNEILFSVMQEGIFNPLGKWEKSIKSKKEYNLIFNKDDKGVYYSFKGSKINRKDAKLLCSKDGSEKPW